MHLPGDVRENDLNHYRLGPLRYVSEIELPELTPTALQSVSASADLPVGPGAIVHIRIGVAPAHLAAPVISAAFCEANASEFLLRIEGVATYYVRNGAEVVVQPAAAAPALDIRSYLLGSVFAALCHQRALLPLHASAIATPRGAVAFLGNSGAGKSSLAAFLARRGHRIVADDICLVDPAAPLERRVLPLAPWLKLWGATLDALEHPSEGLDRIFSDEDKYRYTLTYDAAPIPLAEIILLDDPAGAPDDTPANIATPHFERLAPAHALHALLELMYQSWLVRAMGQTESYFLSCSRALEGVRVFRMHRTWGFAAMNATLDALEAHLSEMS